MDITGFVEVERQIEDLLTLGHEACLKVYLSHLTYSIVFEKVLNMYLCGGEYVAIKWYLHLDSDKTEIFSVIAIKDIALMTVYDDGEKKDG